MAESVATPPPPSSSSFAPSATTPNKTIVIHPGSYYLRIGLASDSYPQFIPHVIARRILNQQPVTAPTPPAPLAPAAMSVKIKALSQIKEFIDVLTSGTEAPDEYLEPTYTEKTCATPMQGSHQWTDTSKHPSYLVGEEALNLSPTDKTTHYMLVRPLRTTTISPTPKYSHAALCNDLQTIWTYAIENKLGISQKEFGSFSACLVVPDEYGKSEIKDMLQIILRDMGFRAALVSQSSVCATFGAGLVTACVVDVGHSRTRVACVDEGVALPVTRRMAPFGFSDVGRLAGWLLRNPTYHPYYFPSIPYSREESAMHELLETHATLIPERVHATKTFEFKLVNPPSPPVLYHTTIADVTSIAPMGLFYPDAMKPLSFEINEKENNANNNYNNYYNNYNDPEDFFDDPYLLEGISGPRLPKPEIEIEGLDVIVANSIGNIGTNLADKSELKRKLYGTILLTGGAARLPGLESVLEDRLFDKLPTSLEVERVEVVPSGELAKTRVGSGMVAGYRDPGLRGDHLAWRGGAIVASVESAKDLWMRREEWIHYGIALLRERLPFGPI